MADIKNPLIIMQPNEGDVHVKHSYSEDTKGYAFFDYEWKNDNTVSLFGKYYMLSDGTVTFTIDLTGTPFENKAGTCRGYSEYFRWVNSAEITPLLGRISINFTAEQKSITWSFSTSGNPPYYGMLHFLITNPL